MYTAEYQFSSRADAYRLMDAIYAADSSAAYTAGSKRTIVAGNRLQGRMIHRDGADFVTITSGSIDPRQEFRAWESSRVAESTETAN